MGAARESDWFKCYSAGWRNEIVPGAFSHPAKFARGLIRRIYEYALGQGYLKEGQTVIDPFGGIALGAADALANGLNFVGVELEQSFVDMGAGCDCTGISKADWMACFGRWKRFAHEDGRHWCPRCLAEAERIIAPRPPTLPGMGPEPTASYERNSGKIPRTGPHRYAGNLDLFAKHAKNGATAVLLQGDSRRLVEVLEGARAEGIIASPPFSSTLGKGGETKGFHSYDKDEAYNRCKRDYVMPSAEGQLGNMPTGEPPQAVIASPPYTGDGVGHDAGHPRLDAAENARREAEGCGRWPAYGKSDGQLAAMREGDVDAVIASPPYSGSLQGTAEAQKSICDTPPPPGAIRKYKRKPSGYGYGQSDGQLAALPEGEPPPYQTGGHHKHQMDAWNTNEGGQGYTPENQGYGNTPGQLQGSGDTFWSAARAILLQCHAVLAPGGIAIFVTKRFVRDKAIVDFSQQWADLCQSCGFELIEWIKAWLVEERGTQYDLMGEAHTKTIERKSFFRRLYEYKARAAEFWLSVSRPGQAARLWQAHEQLWQEYNKGMGSPEPSNIRPTHTRITSRAQIIAYKNAGEPDIETDTQIDWEDVLVFRKPRREGM